jgi:putative ABC transport system ATP-binding protein
MLIFLIVSIMIKTQGIGKVYRAGGVSSIALQHININIRQGELVAITGPSGCGKSTLLNILGMIDKPDDGSYLFDDKLVSAMSEKQRAVVRKENIGYIFQNFNLINELTIFENVELPLLYTKMPLSQRRERVNELLDRLKIAHRANHYPQQLSGGQQQRVAVARAISNQPKLILADEPTGNLDTKNGDEVIKQLLHLNQEGATVIIVTHSLHYAQYCDRIIKLLDGQVFAEEGKQELYV